MFFPCLLHAQSVSTSFFCSRCNSVSSQQSMKLAFGQLSLSSLDVTRVRSECSCTSCLRYPQSVIVLNEGMQFELHGKVLRHEGGWGSGCIDPHFLDLGISWRWVVSFTLLSRYLLRKSPGYPLDRRLGAPRSRSGRYGEVKILDPTRTRTLTPLVVLPTATSYTDWATAAHNLSFMWNRIF
jgi:hypothetical protein